MYLIDLKKSHNLCRHGLSFLSFFCTHSCQLIALVLLYCLDKTNAITIFPCISLRMLLHKSCAQSSGGVQRLQGCDPQDNETTQNFVQKILSDSLEKLENEAPMITRPIRWELGACWVQHLQNQTSEKTETNKSEETKNVPTVKGLGKQFGQLKEIKKKTDDKSGKGAYAKENASPNTDNAHTDNTTSAKEDKKAALQKLLPEAAFQRLKESETGLHAKVLNLSSRLQRFLTLLGVISQLYIT